MYIVSYSMGYLKDAANMTLFKARYFSFVLFYRKK
jgi:hypothetical protein